MAPLTTSEEMRAKSMLLGLNRAQVKTCELLAAGFEVDQVAVQLDISESTVRVHRHRAEVALGIRLPRRNTRLGRPLKPLGAMRADEFHINVSAIGVGPEDVGHPVASN